MKILWTFTLCLIGCLVTAEASAQVAPQAAPSQFKEFRTFMENTRSAPATDYLGGAVARLVGIDGGVVSGVFNLESPGVSAPGRRPRHDEPYHEA
jgi:hypothetical protein